MFFEPRNGHELPHNPFKAIVAPRPIGWISSVSAEGVVNLGPYSFFNAIADSPPLVMFSSSGKKDSMTNVEATREFVVNLATRDLAEQMNQSSGNYPPEVDEFEPSRLTAATSHVVKPPRVAESPAALECKLVRVMQLEDAEGQKHDRWMAIGEVVGVHIRDEFLTDGLFDMVKAGTIARCGYFDYAEVTSLFQMRRPQL